MILRIRNFCIISHIDHGKSTLADRLIEITGTVPKEKLIPQMLDNMELERERGITIKMAPVRMIWRTNHSEIRNPKSEILNKSQIQNSNFQNSFEFRNSSLEFASSEFILNLIDTPGHVDFSYEVSRALACVEGAVLLVDATKGVQAQTLSCFYAAQKQGLAIVPAINKIDLSVADIEKTREELGRLVGPPPLLVSAKTGQGVSGLIDAIVKYIPSPQVSNSAESKALIFDSLYDEHKGVIVYIRVFNGEFEKGDRIILLGALSQAEALEVGYFHPERRASPKLSAGEIGYLVTNLKSLGQARVGDTIIIQNAKFKNQNLTPIQGFDLPKPMVWASIFPVSPADTPLFRDSLEKIKLTDASLIFEPETIAALGSGFRVGFLGLLHLEIIVERLRREYALDLVVTSPSVKFHQVSPNIYEEPYVKLQIITPGQYLGSILALVFEHRGAILDHETFSDRNLISAEIPLAEVIVDFYDQLKSASQGYGSMDYEFIGYRASDLAALDILVADEKVEPFSQLVHRSKLNQTARSLVVKLKDLIPRQNFEVKIQGVVGGKIVASERIPPLRKDVTAKLYGGDVTRKRKLLEKQATGKKRMRSFGRVAIPSDVFLKVLRRQ